MKTADDRKRSSAVIAVLSACILALAPGVSAVGAQPTDDSYNRGKAALEGKRYAEAAEEFATAEAREPHATNALALRAKALIHLDRFDEAERCLSDYLQSHPQSADAKYLLGYVLFRMNRASQSLGMYTAAAALQLPTAEDFKIVGLDYVLLNDNSDAIRWLEKSVKEGPNDAEAVYYLGRAYYVENDFDRAIAAFEQALRLDPHYAKAENNLGLALAAKNEPKQAESAYRRAIEMGDASGSKSDQPYLNLAELLSHSARGGEALSLVDEAERISGKSERSEELRGQILLDQNRLPDAEAAFRAAIAGAPSNGALHYLLGRVLRREGKPQDAEKEFARSKGLRAGQSSAVDAHGADDHIRAAKAYSTERPLEAIDELKEALAMAPENAEAADLVRQIAKTSALRAMRSGERDKALAILVKARQALANDAEVEYEFGFVAFESGLYRDAEQALEKALNIRRDYPEAMYALARTYLAENRAQQAEDEMRRYIALRPKDASAQYGLGYILMAEQRVDQARGAFDESLALQPDQTESIFQLGEIALEQGKSDEASEQFRKVLERDPHHGGALTEMGVLAYHARKYDEAEGDFEKAIQSAPSYQKAHYYCGLTLSKLGRKTEADREFAAAKSLQKEHGPELRLAATQP